MNDVYGYFRTFATTGEDATIMGAPWIRKFGNPSMREILVVTSADAPTSVQTLGEGEGSPKATRRGVENTFFSWREIALRFWATGVFLGGKSHVCAVAFEKATFF